MGSPLQRFKVSRNSRWFHKKIKVEGEGGGAEGE